MGHHINEGFFYKKMYGHFAGWPKKVTIITRWLCYWGGRKWGFTVVPFIFMVQLCYPSAGCKENHFYSLLFWHQLKLALSSPDIISTSPRNFLTSRIDFTVLLLFEFLKKTSLARWASEKQNSLAWQQNPLAPGYQTLLSLHAAPVTRHYCSKPNSHKFWP